MYRICVYKGFFPVNSRYISSSNVERNKTFSRHPLVKQQEVLMSHMYKSRLLKNNAFSTKSIKQLFKSNGHLMTNYQIAKIASDKKFQGFFCLIKGHKSSYVSLTELGEKEARSSTELFDQSMQRKSPHYRMNIEEILLLYLWEAYSKKNQPVLLSDLTKMCRSNGLFITNNKLKPMISSKSFQHLFHILECHKNKVYIKLTKSGEDEANSLESNTISKKKLCLKPALKQDNVTQNINNHSIYRSFSRETGQVQYVGRTNSINRRRVEHLRQKDRIIFQIEELKNLTLQEARVVEQSLIDLYGLRKNGGILENAIQSIKSKSSSRKF